MRGDLLPLFPLPMVLLPHAPLPLHIFEDRYKEMIREVMASGGVFGVVLARDNGILETGCTAMVERVLKDYEDGRFDILAVGLQRFRVLSIDTDRQFLRGVVEEVEDDEGTLPTRERVQEVLRLHAAYAEATGAEGELPDPADNELSFVLGAISPDIDFKQMLLATLSESRRMDLLAAHLAQLIRKQSLTEVVRKAAQTNGHGKHLKGLEH